MVSKGGHKRKSTLGMVPVSFSRIEGLILKVDEKEYGDSLISGLTGEQQKLRNKALIVLLYYSARRISEILGRVLKLDAGYDVWEGVKVKDFRFDILKGKEVVIMNVRILKKGKANRDSIRKVMREVPMNLAWPRIEHLVAWYEHQKGYGPKTKMFKINRHRAYQILTDLDKNVFNHWLRHQRFSHMAEHLTPFELNERLGFWERLDPAISYVHGKVSTYLDAGDKVVR